MNSNQEIMLKALSAALHNKTTDAISKDTWDQLIKEMKAQAVSALLLNSIDSVCPSDEQKLKYLTESMQYVGRFHLILEEQDELFALLDRSSIPTVILKGTAAAMSYPYPEYRSMGDIDLIVLPEDFEKAFAVLKENGYATKETTDNYVRHIGFNSQSGIHIELHNYFSSSANKEQNSILDRYVYEGIKDRKTIELYGHSVYVLPNLANGLVLLGHINQHLHSGLGLRQIIDWMCYAEKYLNDEFWYTTFSKAADSIGMKRLAEVTTYMCHKYLGMNSEITWHKIKDTEIADELMEYILSHGNFGRKDAATTKTVSVLRILKNPIKGIGTLQKMGCRNWKILEKHSWLKPFAWLYQIVRFISHGLKMGVNIKKAIRSSKIEESETEFLKKLGITRLD